MEIEALIPTVNKSKEQILELCHSLNIQSNCIIANQNGIDSKYFLTFKGFRILVICTATIGVSKNRNILLDHLTGDVGLMLDDDCVMHSDYVEKISNFFDQHKKAEFVLFNGSLFNNGAAKLIHNRATKQVSKFFQISYAGAPGLCFRRTSLRLLGLYYDETLGVPNYIEAGEDTVFHKRLIEKKVCFFRSSDVIFDIFDNNEKSSYYKGIDKRYVETRGYVTYYLHPRLFFFYKIRHCLRFNKTDSTIGFLKLICYFNNGKRIFKNNEETKNGREDFFPSNKREL